MTVAPECADNVLNMKPYKFPSINQRKKKHCFSVSPPHSYGRPRQNQPANSRASIPQPTLDNPLAHEAETNGPKSSTCGATKHPNHAKEGPSTEGDQTQSRDVDGHIPPDTSISRTRCGGLFPTRCPRGLYLTLPRLQSWRGVHRWICLVKVGCQSMQWPLDPALLRPGSWRKTRGSRRGRGIGRLERQGAP